MRRKPPSYRKKTVRSRPYAVVTLSDRHTGERRDIWLGPYGTDESRQKYAQAVAEWEAADRTLPRDDAPRRRRNDITITQLVWRYWSEYVKQAGYSPGQVASHRSALRLIRSMYGETPAQDFGPNALRTVREAMLQGDPNADPPRQPWNRSYVTSQTAKITRMFRWAVGQEALAPECHARLQAIEPIRRGKGRESRRVTNVPTDHVDAIHPFVSRQVWAMVELQRLTGMRSGEVAGMTPGAIDRSGKIWLYTLGSHKTAHHGKARFIALGPKAQIVIAPFLDRGGDQPLFSPREAEAERGKDRPRVSSKYDSGAYRKAIGRACEQAGVPRWHPHQLRHNYATEMQRRHGIETSRVLLGHSSISTTGIYVERDIELARQVAAEHG